jgi:tRNA-dihydrouridine synthase
LQDLDFDEEMIEQVGAANRARDGDQMLSERRLIPVSVKTRLGYDRVIVEDWLTTLLTESPAAISLHGRTLEQGYKGEADWQAIARAVEIAKRSGTLILGNGDVRDLQDVYRRVRQTGVDGVLIGRSAQGNPWMFRGKEAVKQALSRHDEGILRSPPVDIPERFRVIVEHSEHFERLCGRSRFMAMRKHLTWYCRNFRGAAEMRARMTRANSTDDVRRCFAEFMAGESTSGQSATKISYAARVPRELPSSPDKILSCD